MKEFFLDMYANMFAGLKTHIKNNILYRTLFFAWVVFLVIAVITVSISLSRHLTSKIDIKQVEYDEFSNSCLVWYTVENYNKSMLYNFTLQYDVTDKNTGRVIYSGREYVGSMVAYSNKERFSISFKTIQTDNYGIEHRTPYSDMVIKYKIVKTEWNDGMIFGLTMWMSIGFTLIPFAYFFGKFFFIVFPMCVYAYSFLIKNSLLRVLTRLLLFLPYILGALWFQFQDPRQRGLVIKHLGVAVDVNGKVVGSYDPETHEVKDKIGRVVVPTNKK